MANKFDGTIDGIIQRMITHIQANPNRIFTVTELKNIDLDYIFNMDYNFDKAIKTMTALKIISVDQFDHCRLEERGYEIFYQGGWHNYLDNEKYRRNIIALNYKWFWGGVLISIVSAIVSITKATEKSTIESRLQKVESQLQGKQTIPSIYTLPSIEHPSTTLSPSKE